MNADIYNRLLELEESAMWESECLQEVEHNTGFDNLRSYTINELQSLINDALSLMRALKEEESIYVEYRQLSRLDYCRESINKVNNKITALKQELARWSN